MYKKYNKWEGHRKKYLTEIGQYYNERNIIIGILYQMKMKDKEFQKRDRELKTLAAKCVKAIRYYMLDNGGTIKQYFDNEVNLKLKRKKIFINYRTFLNYLKAIENQTMTIGKQMITARTLIKNTFDDSEIMKMLWRACDGLTYIYDEPLDNYRAHKRELKRKKREYY